MATKFIPPEHVPLDIQISSSQEVSYETAFTLVNKFMKKTTSRQIMSSNGTSPGDTPSTATTGTSVIDVSDAHLSQLEQFKLALESRIHGFGNKNVTTKSKDEQTDDEEDQIKIISFDVDGPPTHDQKVSQSSTNIMSDESPQKKSEKDPNTNNNTPSKSKKKKTGSKWN